MTKKTIFEFEVSTGENLHFQLNFLGLDLSGRTLQVRISERHSTAHVVTLSAPNVELVGTGTITVRYPKASMVAWSKIQYQADLFDITGGNDKRILATRFVYDEPGRLVHGVKGAQATIQWGANEAVITAIGGVGPAGPSNVLTAGSIEVLDPDAEPELLITGESPNQQLHLKMPRGQPGFADKLGAEAARDQALAYSNQAEVHKNAASASASAALAQRNAADAAKVEAATAATTAVNASNSIGNAVSAAETAAGVAVAARDVAVDSADSAANDASIAITKAGEAVGAAATATIKAGESSTSAGAALSHKMAAETAQEAAEEASTLASADRVAAQTARTGSETARTGSESAKTAAEAARDLALTYRNTTLTYRDATEGFRNEAEAFKNQAAASAALAASFDPTSYYTKTAADALLGNKAPIANPVFTGQAQAPSFKATDSFIDWAEQSAPTKSWRMVATTTGLEFHYHNGTAWVLKARLGIDGVFKATDVGVL